MEKISGLALESLDKSMNIATFTNCGCFVAGTMVWTDKGEVPIEKIQVGDLVLSQPDTKGERTYKRVVKTMIFDDKVIRNIAYSCAPDGRNLDHLFVTEDHPFWIQGVGWRRADLLEPGDWLELVNDERAQVCFNLPVYRTEEPGVGWVPDGESSDYRVETDRGFEMNFLTWELLRDNVAGNCDIRVGDNPYLKTRVYNFDVEDFRTYYVGGGGVWVHNKNCAELWESCRAK